MLWGEHPFRLLTTAVLAGVICLGGCTRGPDSRAGRPLLIANVEIIDGSGSPRFMGSVRVADGIITEVGNLESADDEVIVHGQGLVLAPGFIDTHSHADRHLLDQPDALAAVSQGITTVIVGQDGQSPYPLAGFIGRVDASGSAVNVAAYVGHNTIRDAVLGDDVRRAATDDEIAAMQALLRDELDAGALGLSTGLEYEPGIHSSPGEVLALAQTAADADKRYISHLRSEDRRLEAALDEIIEIGRVTGMPVQISHFKLAMKSLWGRGPELLARLDAARREGIDVTADVYPYEYWQSTMMVLLPERDPTDREAVAFALEELAPPEGIWFTKYDPQPEYVGMRLTEIAAERDIDPVTAFMELAQAAQRLAAQTGESVEAIIGTSMHESDIRTLLAWPHTNICSDGSLADLHPRGAGAFPRILARYVRVQELMSLETAVRKMSGLAADHMGFDDRGYVRAGQAADLVLFDPDIVADRATPEAPGQLAEGIAAVWVSGELVFSNGRATDARPGVFLRR